MTEIWARLDMRRVAALPSSGYIYSRSSITHPLPASAVALERAMLKRALMQKMMEIIEPLIEWQQDDEAIYQAILDEVCK